MFFSRRYHVRFLTLLMHSSHNVIYSFKFTKLDPEDQSRPFTFTLSMDENNNYEISDVHPHIDKNKTDPILCVLNADGKNGFNSFVVGMRKLFKESI
mmetsp:Transcript_31585/g.66880  ORF Transcript_31585/g.66880 Transcript_31585/m.66880 type:complete len:97 (-) Transcript_31585:210-500(-)